MKKILYFLMFACVAMLVSCTSVDDQAETLAHKLAVAETVEDKVAVEIEIREYVETLTVEDKKEFDTAFDEAFREEVRALFASAAQDFSKGMQAIVEEAKHASEIFSEEFAVKYEKTYAEVAEEYAKVYADFSEECSKAATAVKERYQSSGMESAVNEVATAAGEVVVDVARETASIAGDVASKVDSLLKK